MSLMNAPLLSSEAGHKSPGETPKVGDVIVVSCPSWKKTEVYAIIVMPYWLRIEIFRRNFQA